jgi:hypothetical protein
MPPKNRPRLRNPEADDLDDRLSDTRLGTSSEHSDPGTAPAATDRSSGQWSYSSTSDWSAGNATSSSPAVLRRLPLVPQAAHEWVLAVGSDR